MVNFRNFSARTWNQTFGVFIGPVETGGNFGPDENEVKNFFSGPLFSEKLRRDGRSACPELQCQSRSLSKEEGLVGDLSPVVLSSPFLFFHLSEWRHLLQTAGMKPTAAAATAAATPLSSRSLPRSGKTASYRSNKLVKKPFKVESTTAAAKMERKRETTFFKNGAELRKRD